MAVVGFANVLLSQATTYVLQSIARVWGCSHTTIKVCAVLDGCCSPVLFPWTDSDFVTYCCINGGLPGNNLTVKNKQACQFFHTCTVRC